MNTNLIETKVAAATGTGGLASIVVLALQLADPHLNINPALVSLIVTAVMGIAGWAAPHTSRPIDPGIESPAGHLGDVAAAVGVSAPDLVAAFQHATAERLALMRAQTKPADAVTPAQPSPSGTTTGPMA